MYKEGISAMINLTRCQRSWEVPSGECQDLFGPSLEIVLAQSSKANISSRQGRGKLGILLIQSFVSIILEDEVFDQCKFALNLLIYNHALKRLLVRLALAPNTLQTSRWQPLLNLKITNQFQANKTPKFNVFKSACLGYDLNTLMTRLLLCIDYI